MVSSVTLLVFPLLLVQLAQANMMIDLLPIPAECKPLFKSVIPQAEAAFKWIKETSCTKGQCTPPFAPAFTKYGPFVKNTVVLEWVFGTFKNKGHDIASVGIDVSKIYDSIVNDCLMGDPKIKNTKNVCAAKKEDFEAIKGCVIPKVIEYVPKVGKWAQKACKIATSERLVEKVAKPEFKPDWRKMVTDFVNSPECKGQFS